VTGEISNLLLTLISDWNNPVKAVFNLKPLSVTRRGKQAPVIGDSSYANAPSSIGSCHARANKCESQQAVWAQLKSARSGQARRKNEA